MKHLIILSLGTALTFSAFAQSNKEDVDMIQAMYGKEKKAIVADFIMPPDATKKTAFWNLYDKYETERKALGKKRVALLEKYAGAYTSLDDKSTDAIMLETMNLQKKRGRPDRYLLQQYQEISWRKTGGSVLPDRVIPAQCNKDIYPGKYSFHR